MTPTERSQLVADIVARAVHVAAEDQEAFLVRECRGDEETVAAVRASLAASAAAHVPPRRIGRYEVIREVGSGGFGSVYRALDPTFGRVVAIKVLTASGQEETVQRFRVEAKTVANLHHKNIVTVHEFGDEAGEPYLVMEYLDGTTLQALIQQRSLSLLEKLEIMLEVAEGLQHAHERGVIHRDIKPANIMRMTDGTVKIMDFGIARLAADESVRLTKTGLVVGSLAYMAPEQFHGTADATSDVFSFGVTLYELLTGHNPYVAADPAAVIFRITNTDPPPIRMLAPQCPSVVDRIVRTSLARSREARYSGLADVIVDIRSVLVDLRKEQAAGLYAEASERLAAAQLDEAKAAVRRVLELDPAHPGARSLRSDIEEALRRRETAARAAALMDQTEAALRERKFDEVAGLLAAIKQLNVNDPGLDERMERAQAQLEQATRQDRLLDAAWDDLKNQNLTDAFRAVSESMSSDPTNPMAARLLQEIRGQMALREARHRLLEEAVCAESLLLTGDTDDAIALLRDIESRHPEFAEAAQLRGRAEAQKAQEEVARRLAEGKAAVKALIKTEWFDEAVTRIDSLLNDAPGSGDLKALRKNVSERQASRRRRERVAKLKSEARGWIDAENFDAAIYGLKAGIAELGDNGDLMDLLQMAATGKAAKRRRRSQGGRLDPTPASRPSAPQEAAAAPPAPPAAEPAPVVAPATPKPAPAPLPAAPVKPRRNLYPLIWFFAVIALIAILYLVLK